MIGAELALTLALAQQTKQEQIIPLVFGDEVVFISETNAQKEYDALIVKPTLTFAEQGRLSALAIALETIPNRCTVEQERALLCLRLTNE
jgi:hypothetical protein